MSSAPALSSSDRQLYDRQLRLWGLDVQTRLRSSSILLIGFRALAAEIAKNLVLTGIGSLTIVERRLNPTALQPSERFQSYDVDGNLFLSGLSPEIDFTPILTQKLTDLNPNVAIHINSSDSADSLPPSFFHQFTLICLSDTLSADLSSLARQIAQFNAKPTLFGCPANRHIFLFSCDLFGLYGYSANELYRYQLESKLGHSVSVDSDVSIQELLTAPVAMMEKVYRKTSEKNFLALWIALRVLLQYCSSSSQTNSLAHSHSTHSASASASAAVPASPSRYPSAQDLDAVRRFRELMFTTLTKESLSLDYISPSMLSTLFQGCSYQLAPQAAVFGGFVAQEIINTISRKWGSNPQQQSEEKGESAPAGSANVEIGNLVLYDAGFANPEKQQHIVSKSIRADQIKQSAVAKAVKVSHQVEEIELD